jgi:hypothetical protein
VARVVVLSFSCFRDGDDDDDDDDIIISELSETLINTKVDMMQDLVEQEGLADESVRNTKRHFCDTILC